MHGNNVHLPLRDVVEGPLFAEQVSKLTADIRRFDDVMEGVFWALARDPERFPVVHEASNIRIVKTDAWGGTPLCVFFTFDDNQTRLLSVEPIQFDNETSLSK